MKECAILFGKTNSLVGILTNPSKTDRTIKLPAILLLNAGLTHRVCLNRLHVKIARKFAASGFVVFRFDFSGIGDSRVRRDHLPFTKSAVSETQEAMDYLDTVKGIDRFVLMGICSGGAISYKTACCDDRVVGAVLINAIGHLHGDDEKTWTSLRNRSLFRHYWRILLHSSFRAKNWKKTLTGKIVGYRSILRMMFSFPLKGLFGYHNKEPSVMNKAVTDLCLLTEHGVRLLLIYSEGDEGLDYLHLVLGDKGQSLSTNRSLKLEIIQGANHTFTLLWSQEHLVNSIHHWIQEIVAVEP